MKKIYFPLFLTLFSCCSSGNIDYQVIEEAKIEYPDAFIQWQTLLAQECSSYYVYVFAYDCYYCNESKRKVICFYEHSEIPVYFCEYTKEIPIGHNTMKTIGSNNLEDIFIRGTPSLLYITDGCISFNVSGKQEVFEMIDLQLKNEL